MVEKSKSVPTAFTGGTPEKIRSGVIIAPPPIPVRPTRIPTINPSMM